MKYDYLIIGGGVAGVTAAEAIRKSDPKGTIGILTNESHPLYSRVLIPHYLKGKISRESVFLRSLGDMEKQNINLHTNEEAESIDTEAKSVKIKTGEFQYGKLLIATGGRIRAWDIPGSDLSGVLHMQTIEDADAILSVLKDAKTTAVIGGGFIALEFLETMVIHKKDVTLLCKEQAFFGGKLDALGTELMDKNFRDHGIKTIYGADAKEFRGNGTLKKILLQSGEEVQADAVGIGIGIERNLGFLPQSIEKNSGGIKTNEFLETNVPSIWAAGDIANYYDGFYKKQQTLGNWTNALMQGMQVGQNMAGEKKSFQVLFNYAISNLGLNIAFIGDTSIDAETEAISRGNIEKKQYERFFIKHGALQGAIMINMGQDRGPLTSLIQKQSDISPKKNLLSDMTADIRAIAL
ncbi:MAG: FAD/NAD(P)-binding oxidoreductase [Patescibacteria group bacterium]